METLALSDSNFTYRAPVGATIVNSLEKATLNIVEWLYCSQKVPHEPVSKFRLPKTEQNKKIIE